MKMNIKDWVLDNYDEDTRKNICEHGMVSGFAGLTYYDETIAFHDEHEEEIWEMLSEDARETGLSVLEFIGSFNGGNVVECMTALKNLLSWYAVERVCYGLNHEEQA